MKTIANPTKISTRQLFAALCAILLLVGFSPRASAALLAYEPFTNGVGTAVVGSSGGYGFTQPWQLNAGFGVGTNLGYGLSYSDGVNSLQTSGGAAFFQAVTTANQNVQPSRAFNFSRGTNNLTGVNGVTSHADGVFTYISFLSIRQGPTGTAITGGGFSGSQYGRGVNIPLDLTNMTGGAVLQKAAFGNGSGIGTNAVGLLSGGGATRPGQGTTWGSPTTASITNLVVAAIEHVSGAPNDNMYLWVNPTSAGGLALGGANPALSTAVTNVLGLFDYSFDRMRIFVGGQANAGQPYGELIISDYRIGESWADVTPFASGSQPAGIATDLTNKLAQLCANASFFISATGSPPLNYFWFANNAPTGGNSNSLVLNNLAPANGGSYFVIVSNTAGTATSTVVSLTLIDTTLPTITQCATNQTLFSDGACQAQIPSVTNQVAATDCSGIASITQSPVAGTVVGVGAYVVTITVTDNSNNVATCQATITVNANGTPVLVSCAPNQFLNADTNQQAAIPNLTSLVVATNPCGSVTVTQSPPAGTIVGPGVQVVTLTAFTASGTTNCSANVNVNARPVASSQSVSTGLNTPLNLTLGGSDADGGSLTFLITSGPAHGTLGTLSSNLVTYTPTPAYVGADSFTFAISDGAVTSAVATVSISVTNGDIIYPATPQIVKDGTAVLLENYANAPFSSRTYSNYPPVMDLNGQLSRINFMRPEPTNAPGYGSRYFVCDLNRTFYIVPKANPLATNTWIKYLNMEEIFPRFDGDPGYAGGLATFAFDPEYATNGIFYTVHMETTAATLAPTNGAYPALDLTGYTTTTAINPPSGTVARIAVLIEWRDTNVANTTFEGTAREILRLGFFNTIHPLGDLLYNPNALPGHPDYRNLYLAVGDGAAGETAGTTHTHPQQLNAFAGKILRITPDLNLRPTDEVSSNGRYHIPTNGPDPNPFVFTNAYFTNLTGVRHEIYAYGFRNPHRMSWDAVSGNLFVNDIGLNSWEEVNLIHKGTNYGWAEREGPEQMLVSGSPAKVTGSQQTIPVPFPASDLLTVTGIAPAITPTYPVAAYSSRDGDAISSGFVYRGTLMPQLYGKYIFADITTARMFYCDLNEMLAADDGVRTTLAPIHELQICFNSPFDAPDQGVVARRLFDVVSETYHQKGGTNANANPGGATVTGLTGNNMPGGVPFGGGRADIRLAVGDDNEIYIISKSDASIRKMTAVVLPVIQSISASNNVASLTWSAVKGLKYRLQYKQNIEDVNWTSISPDVTATNSTASATNSLGGSPQRFYHVMLVP